MLIGLIEGMWIPCAKIIHFVFAPIDPLKWRVESKGLFFFLLFGKGKRFEEKAVSSGCVIGRLFDGLTAEEFAFFGVFVSEMLEYFK